GQAGDELAESERGVRQHRQGDPQGGRTAHPKPLVGSPGVGAQPVSHSEVPPPPGVWSVPAWTGRNLAARDGLLAEISDALTKRGLAPLCGLGGAGKSMLAIEYAHRHAGAYDTVFLLHGESVETLDADLVSLAAE